MIMFTNAQQSESRRRETGLGIPSKRVPARFFHRRNCCKNQCASEYHIEIRFWLRKVGKNRDFKNYRQSQNVCGFQKIINGAISLLSLKREKTERIEYTLSGTQKSARNVSFQINDNFSVIGWNLFEPVRG